MPGEAAAKLALAAAAECAQRDEQAGRYYTLVARPDPSQADAVFGLARARIRAGDRDGAVRALDAVPSSSSRHVAAQLGAVQAILSHRTGEVTDEAQLRAAAARVERLDLDPATDHEVRGTLLDAAVEIIGAGGGPDPSGTDTAPFLGCSWRERELRLALERCLRASARLATDPATRIALVDRANAAHPRTWT